jgi:uncharacterized protein (DUF2384 family)
MLTNYDPHQGDKSNVEWLTYQMRCLYEFLGEEGTQKWLYRPNPQLGNLAPIHVIIETDKDKGFKIIGDLISDMLTGSPS